MWEISVCIFILEASFLPNLISNQLLRSVSFICVSIYPLVFILILVVLKHDLKLSLPLREGVCVPFS